MKLTFFSDKKKIVIASYLIGFFVASAGILIRNYLVSRNQSNLISPQPETDVLSASHKQMSPQPISDLKTLGVLLLGYGGVGHQGGYLTDTIQILFLDFEKRKIALISIPRDLWLKLPNGREGKINSILSTSVKKASSEASEAENLKKIISTITGIKINYFVGIDFVGFQRIIGINLKGIDVYVSQTLDDPWYPITGEELNTCGMTAEKVAELSKKYSGFELERQFPCRYEHLHFDKGLVHMEGGDVLKYVRSRHGSAEGDVSRGKRAQEVLIAIGKKLFSLNALGDIPTVYNGLVKHVSTDIDLQSAKYLGPLLKSFQDIKVVNINLSATNVFSLSKAKNGQSIMIPKEGINKWNKVHLFIKEQLNLMNSNLRG